ncbi:hypothetical protein BH24ACT23_BH24ACT23_09270 [soil metagenome]
MSLEAGTFTNAGRVGLLGRRSRLLRLQGDERLIAMMRAGQERAFEALVERYQARLFAFCRGMLGSAEDAEDILQEVFVAAHKAILADNRRINARPWLYRIARNRCLNHMRRQVPDAQESMDVLPHDNGISTADRVEGREELRAVIGDVHELPETQRTALLLREIDAMAYEEIAVAMDTTVPAVKSLLVRARMSLADSSQGRLLTCDEVHLELAEAAEGIRKTSGPARAHIKSCKRCQEYRKELRRNGKALAALAPIGPLAALFHGIAGKLSFGGAKAGAGIGSGSSTGASGAGVGGASAAGTAGAGAVGTAGAAGTTVGGAAAAGGGGALGVASGSAAAAIGTKAAAGVASMALLTAGAVEVRNLYKSDSALRPAAVEQSVGSLAAGGLGEQNGSGSGHQSRGHAGGAAASGSTGDDGPTPAAEPTKASEPTPVSEVAAEPAAPASKPEEPASDGAAGEPTSGTGSLDPATGGAVGPGTGTTPPAVDPPASDPPPPPPTPAPSPVGTVPPPVTPPGAAPSTEPGPDPAP